MNDHTDRCTLIMLQLQLYSVTRINSYYLFFKNETSGVENENLNDDTEGNKSSREDKKIFDDSSRNKIDKKLDLTNKQVDHKVGSHDLL